MEKLSISNGIVYEKIDRNNWLRVPKHSQVPVTTYLDVQKLTIDTKSIGKDKANRPNIQQMLEKM